MNFNLAPTIRRVSLRGRHLLLFDVVASAMSFVIALALRFDAPSQRFDDYLRAYSWVIPLLVGMRLASFIWLRLYQRVWRYASVDELLAVLAAVLGSSTIAYLLVFAVTEVMPFDLPFPRSIPIIDSLLVVALAGAWRFGLRVVQVGRSGARSENGRERTLVVGGGSAALAAIRELRHGDLPFVAVGIVADDLPRGQRLMGVPVLGRLDSLGEITRRQHAAVVLFALPSAEGRTIRRLLRAAEEAGARCLTVPSIAEVVSGRVRINTIREIQVDDLLRRAPARIDVEGVAASFDGQTILITGAGGSIGSELARQLAGFSPRRLLLLGRGENSIFEAMQTLPDFSGTETVPVILDVRDERLEQLLYEARPDVVFHAAAHKHVPLMERYPEEAVATNVLGTSRLVDACLRTGVDRLVLISSDKAVNPTSVMGTTKRISELLVRDAALRSGLRYVSVRFGNVLSSRGSVVPVFQRQLEHGGPITITHEEVARYFMTIPEAVQLVLQAAVLAEPGDTFVLDMGDPVRIVDLARDLAQLHGMELGEDIELRIVGLRPGEKLLEELFFADEHPEPTSHESIRRVAAGRSPRIEWRAPLAELERLARMGARAELRDAMRRIVPEYVPAPEEEAPARRPSR